jgi:hypothetical protein
MMETPETFGFLAFSFYGKTPGLDTLVTTEAGEPSPPGHRQVFAFNAGRSRPKTAVHA